jgi:transcriptional regulator with XRE-family HTH domain
MSDLKATLASEFSDKDYAHSYMHQHLLERFATQLHATRVERGLSQEQLAARSGVPQGKISRLECAEVESFTLATASKLAEALDVAVRFGFQSFSDVIRNVDRSSPADLVVAPRERDLHGVRAVNSLLRGVHMPAGSPVFTSGQGDVLARTVVVTGAGASASPLSGSLK